MSKKKTLFIGLSIILFLLIAFISLVIIAQAKKENIPENSFVIVENDKRIIVSLSDLEKNFKITKFKNRHRNSTGVDEIKSYEGYELKTILDFYKVDYKNKKYAVLSASDSFSKIYDVEKEIMSDKNVFIATKVEGKAFEKGIGQNKDDGGPFVIIKCSDQYSENRVKLFQKIEFK